MKYTRNTKLYKVNYNDQGIKKEIIYRDLTNLEYSFLSNIKNDALRVEMAGKTVIDEIDIPIGTLLLIGKKVLDNITDLLSSEELFNITLDEFKNNIKNDNIMMAIKQILCVLPGQSFTDLLNLNIKDLLELIVLCEEIQGKPILKRGGVKLKHNLTDEDKKSLQQKMNELNKFVG